MKKRLRYFTPFEWCLWLCSMGAIVGSALLFRSEDLLAVLASLLGVTSILFCAKGNPLGQGMMIVFALVYGYISWNARYYGEMITYVGMTAPMAAVALVSWLRHPYKGKRSQVKAARLSRRELLFAALLALAVTAAFYFLLGALGTANLIPSTISVTTSFAAAYLTFRRSPWFAFAYAANDIVLVVLWVLMIREDPGAIPVAVCFAVFLANDLYGFFSWRRMQKRQEES